MPFIPGEKNNIEIILKECLNQGLSFPQFKEDIAYILATARHETATWRTLKEYGDMAYFNRLGYGIYHGRGYVQLTWLGNYQKFSQILGKDLVGNPDLLLEDVSLSAFILVYGMKHGTFTGKRLEDFAYKNAAGQREINFREARRIVNGTDQAQLLANYANEYLQRLNNGEWNNILLNNNENMPQIKYEAQNKQEAISYLATIPDNLIDKKAREYWLENNNIGTPIRLHAELEVKYNQLLDEKEKLVDYNNELVTKIDELNQKNTQLTTQNTNLQGELQAATTLNDQLNQKYTDKIWENSELKTVQNSSTKPFWQSKKFAAIASLAPIIPSLLIYIPEPYGSYAAAIYGIAVIVYQFVQGNIDQIEMQKQLQISLEKFKQVSKN